MKILHRFGIFMYNHHHDHYSQGCAKRKKGADIWIVNSCFLNYLLPYYE